MPEEIEVETKDLQEAIEELHHEREERAEEERQGKWTRYVGLATAIFAVFAALGALQSGSLVNEAMIDQIKASDLWNEYQADRTKVHLYTLQANMLADSGARPAKPRKSAGKITPKPPGDRLGEYAQEIDRENTKTSGLSDEAKKLEKESGELMHKHHRFAYSVTGIQVAIALGAVAALTKMKWIWFTSLVFGVVGVVLFVQGFL